MWGIVSSFIKNCLSFVGLDLNWSKIIWKSLINFNKFRMSELNISIVFFVSGVFESGIYFKLILKRKLIFNVS